MADEDDETFPPEIQKLVTEFAFREFGRLPLIDEDNDSLLHFRSSLLTVANIYGLVVIGHTAGFKIFTDSSLFAAAKSEEETKPDALVDVPLRSPPHWLAVSSDNLTLVVCSSSEKGLQLLFFDTRNLANKAKPTKTPFCVSSLSKSSNDKVTSLQWNPSLENSQFLAVCLTSGTFHMLSITSDVQEVGRKPPEFGACSACWSPRGKQVMVGKRDGSMQQYTPALEIRRTIPVYDEVERNVKVDDILWLSTLQVAFSYTPVSEGDWQPSLFVVTLPPAKDQNKRPSFRNYEDPCYGLPQQRLPHFMMTYLDKWNLFVMSSADAAETAVIGKNKATDLWEIWNIDDSFRAQLPMEDGKDDPSPLGVGVMYTAKERIVVDDSRECGPMPVFVMLSCDGHLSLFHMINLQSQDDYPSLIVRPQQLAIEGERPAVTSKFGSFDPNRQASSDHGKQKASLASSTPLHPQIQALQPDSSQLSTTPLRGSGSFDGDQQSGGKFAPRSLTFPNQSTPAVGNAAHDPAETMPTKLPLASQPVFKVPLGKTNSMAPPKSESIGMPNRGSGSPLNVGAKPETVPPANLESSIGSLSASSANPNSARGSDSARSAGKRRSNEPTLEPSLSSQSSSSVMDGLVSEVLDFEKELNAFIGETSNLDHFVASLGQGKEKMELDQKVEKLGHFGKEIGKATKEQHNEIQAVRDMSLEMYASVQGIETHRQRVENPVYRSALYARPLDMADQRQIKEIRSLYTYIREAMREVGSVLDDQWNKMMQNKPSSLQKSKRRMKIEERETIRQAIHNQTKILHKQEMDLLLLSQKLDELRLFTTSLQIPITEQFTPSKKDFDADLPTLASSLINRNKGDAIREDLSDAKTPSTSHASHISPKKAVQLSDFLASRKSAAIRTSFGKRSKFIAPSLPKPRPKDPQPSMENLSQCSRYSSTSEYESEESATTTESSKPSESSRRHHPPGYYLPNDEAAYPAGAAVVEVPPSMAMHRSLADMYQPNVQPKYIETPSFMRALSPAPPHSTSIEGSSTFSYGGPETVFHQKPMRKFDVSTPMTEAASNLNNPPKVVNIKELSEPEVVNPLHAPKKFEAEPSVPLGAANEVQRVLDFVHAEKSQQEDAAQVDSMSSLPPPTSKLSLLGLAVGNSSAVGQSTSQPGLSMKPSTSVQPSNETKQLTSAVVQPSIRTSQPSFISVQPSFGSTQSLSGLAQPFSAVQPSTTSKSYGFVTTSSMPAAKPAFGSQHLNGTTSTISSQPSFGLAAQASFGSTQPSAPTTHVRTSSQPSNFVMKAPAAQQSSSGLFSGVTLLKKSASEKHIPTSHDVSVKPLTASNKQFAVASSLAPSMSQENTERDLVAGDAPPEGTCLSVSTVAAVDKEELNKKLQPEAKAPESEVDGGPEVRASFLKQDGGAKLFESSSVPTESPPTSSEAASLNILHEKQSSNNSVTDSRKSEDARQTGVPTSLESDTTSPRTDGSDAGLGAHPISTSPEPDNSELVNATSEISINANNDLASTDKGKTSEAVKTLPTSLEASAPKFGAASSFGTAALNTASTYVPKTSTFGEAFVSQTSTASSLFGFSSSTTSNNGTPPNTTTPAIASTSSTFATPATTSGLFSTSSSSVLTTLATTTVASTTESGSLFNVSATASDSPFAAAAANSGMNSLFGAASTTTSSFLSSAASTTSFGSPFSTVAASTNSSSLFGAPTTTSSIFGAPAANSGSLFAATTASSGSLFGAANTTSDSLFGVNTTTSSLFGTSTTTAGSLFGSADPNNRPAFASSGFGAAKFGAPPTFGSSSATTASGATPFGGGFGSSGELGSGSGVFLSGLGAKPTQSSNNSNPFAAVTSSQSSDNKSLFGNTTSSPFSSAFGQSASSGAAFANTNEAQKGFGSFTKPNAGTFGGAAVFGSPSFGAKPAFGAAPQFGSSTFGSPSGFGSPATFGNQMAAATTSGFGSSPGFGAFASSNATGFGALAEQSGSPSGFGAMSNQPPSGFGGFGSTQASSSKPSFTGWR